MRGATTNVRLILDLDQKAGLARQAAECPEHGSPAHGAIPRQPMTVRVAVGNSRLSSPGAVMEQGRPIASNPRITVVPSLSTCVAQAHPPRPSAIQDSLYRSNRHAIDARNMDNSIGEGSKRAASAGTRSGQPGGKLIPGLHQTCRRRLAPLDHKIGTVGAEASRHVGKSLLDRGINVLRLRVDEAHRYAGDHVLERGSPPQGDRACPQLQPEIDQRAEQQQRRSVKKNTVSARRGARGKLTLHDQCSERHPARGYCRGGTSTPSTTASVSGSRSCSTPPCAIAACIEALSSPGWAGKRRQLLQPILDIARGGRRRIKREVQHGGGERGGGGDDRRIVRGGKTGAEHAKIEEGVAQQARSCS